LSWGRGHQCLPDLQLLLPRQSQPLFTAIFRGFTASDFGSRKVKTPFTHAAVIFEASIA